MSLQVAKYPVGLETVKKALLQKSKLNSYETVVRIGLWGIGGIGKTTVAKACYNEIQGNFRAASFVFNVRSASLEKLQGQILKDLVNYEEDVCSVEKGISLLTGRLGGIRALLILDDVDNLEQLDALAGDWLAPGSCLIITSRDKHILNAAHISTGNILQLSGLRKCEGLQLFSWHAFQRKFPIHGYEEISKSIVEACKGHPLSLEVIGSFLYDKKTDTDIDCWTETLQNIAGNRDILKTLKISYSGLSAEEKEIFLDIACFFIGEGTTNPILFWKSMYKTVHTAVTNLSLKLLIKIDKKGVFDMHDLVRDMGRIIAEEERTRQWQPTQPSISFNKVCNINISGLRLFKGDADSLKTLCTPSLRFLQLEHMHIEDVVQILPPSLRWLRMNSCSFPITTDSSNIFNDLILAAKKNCTFLRSRRVWQLRIMDLTDCKSLQILPEPIFNYLSELKSLNFSGYQNLDCLPHSIANLPQLVYLNLSYCERLRYLPEGIGSMLQLEYLNLTSCKLLIELPDSIGNLFRLKHLNLSWCENLKSIPESISMLFKLERLDMLCCYSAWDSIPYAILMQPKLCILGLPPGIVGWRRNTIEEQRTILEPNLFSRKAMAAFRALARSERRILEIFHEKYRSSFSKDTWTRSTDPRFSKDMWTRSTDPRPLGENHFSEDTGRSRTDPRPFNVMN